MQAVSAVDSGQLATAADRDFTSSTGVARLAAAVLARAICDARSVDPRLHQPARHWLTHPDHRAALEFWLRLAGLSDAFIRDHALDALTSGCDCEA